MLASLARHQFSAVRHAVEQARPITRHAIDIRGAIALIFARCYLVLLAGRDKRSDTRGPDTRGRESRMHHALSLAFGALVLGGVILIPVTVIILLIDCTMKSFLGVDLTRNQHFFDLPR